MSIFQCQLPAYFFSCHQGNCEIKTKCSVCFRSDICMSALDKSSKEKSRKDRSKTAEINGHFFFFCPPLNPMSFGSGPRGMSELYQPHWDAAVQMPACCLASPSSKVQQRLADACSIEGILLFINWISQRDPAQRASCFSAWRQSGSWPTRPCCSWWHPHPPEALCWALWCTVKLSPAVWCHLRIAFTSSSPHSKQQMSGFNPDCFVSVQASRRNMAFILSLVPFPSLESESPSIKVQFPLLILQFFIFSWMIIIKK